MVIDHSVLAQSMLGNGSWIIWNAIIFAAIGAFLGNLKGQLGIGLALGGLLGIIGIVILAFVPKRDRGAGGPGWYADPYRRHDVRYFDGFSWTDSVDSGKSDPIPTGAVPVPAPAGSAVQPRAAEGPRPGRWSSPTFYGAPWWLIVIAIAVVGTVAAFSVLK